MNYYWYDKTGQILLSANGITEQEAVSNPFSKLHNILRSEDIWLKASDAYIENGYIKKKPPKPNIHSKWNIKFSKWEDTRDLEKEKIKALLKYPKLDKYQNSYKQLLEEMAIGEPLDLICLDGSIETKSINEIKSLLLDARLDRKNKILRASTLEELDEVIK